MHIGLYLNRHTIKNDINRVDDGCLKTKRRTKLSVILAVILERTNKVHRYCCENDPTEILRQLVSQIYSGEVMLL